ncbi:hypothetical protein ACFL20_12910, partial [Spirochaetota bacterium]
IVISILNCSGSTEIVRKDNLGRVTKVAYYNGRTLRHLEETQYFGNSHNPKIVVYKKSLGMGLIPYKVEEYQFVNNNLASLSFYIYKDNKRNKTGVIKYYYTRNNPSKIEYYSYSKFLNKLFMFGLIQYNYKEGRLSFRRIIEFELNRKSKKSMQIGQYIIFYKKKNKVKSLKSWIMDKVSNKIIKNEEENVKLINAKIGIIEKLFSKSARGMEFIHE